MEREFSTVLVRSSRPYLAAERALRQGGAEAESVLKGHLADRSQISRFVARVILDWTQQATNRNQEVLDWLIAREAAEANTPVGVPRPRGIASRLRSIFGEAAMDVLALRLLKEEEWPEWKNLGVLWYLEGGDVQRVAAPVLRFALVTRDQIAQTVAIEVLRHLPLPVRAEFVKGEQQDLDSMGLRMAPQIERALMTP